MARKSVREAQAGAPAESVPVRLLKPHTHAGIAHDPGARLELAPDTAAWLVQRGVIEIEAAEQPTADD